MTAATGSVTGSPNMVNGCRPLTSSTSSSQALTAASEKPHLDIVLWLKTLQLYEQYGRLFEKFSGVEEIIHYTGRELVELGVKNAAHRATLRSGLAVLREKYKNAVMRKTSSTVTTALVAFYEGAAAGRGQENKSHSNSRRSNDVDGNMNRIENGTPVRQPNVIVSSDDENYINHRIQCSTSTSAGKLSNLNAVNNNEPTPASNTDDIRGHLWYHGSIGRSQAETLVASAQPADSCGQFLVRDCISRAGNYVLTCNWNGSVLHFMINRTILGSTPSSLYERAVYHFEDEHYQSVPDLIRAYVGQKKPVTEESRCVISKPINRPPRSASSDPSTSTTLRHTVSEKSVLRREERSLRIVDEDREQGNYVRMRENKASPRVNQDSSTAPSRGSINANGIANLKIPQVPESIRNRPLPPVPHAETTSASSTSAKASTLRNRVMLKEARRHQLNKWRSESALEEPAHNSSQTILPVAEAANSENLLHVSTSLQSLTKETDNAKCNNDSQSIQQAASSAKAPAKPRRAPSLKNREKPMLVIRDTKTGLFREVSETELEVDGEEHLEDEEECDYHEYCDIDYDQLPEPQQPRKSDKDAGEVSASETGKTPETQGSSMKENNPVLPALPPRPKHSSTMPFSGQDRDSACVPDMILYDRPSALCKRYSPRAASQKATGHYDVLGRASSPAPVVSNSRVKLDAFKSPLLPFDVRPLDSRVWPKIRDLLLTSDAQMLAWAATKADSTYLNLVDDETLLEYVPNHALSSLILLPKGDQFRKDVVERAACWRFFVASSLLQKEPEGMRVELLSKWIDIAKLAIEKLGNEFAFSNVMMALLSPQVSGLSGLWRRLDSDFPKQADAFAKVLRPRFSAIQRCQNASTMLESYADLCIPDLESLARLYGAVAIDELRLFDCEEEENLGDDLYGLESFWQRLQQARQWPMKIHQWRLNFYSQMHSMPDDNDCTLAATIFRTEFHLRYLFGARGSNVAARERHATFQRVLAAMALNAGGQLRSD